MMPHPPRRWGQTGDAINANDTAHRNSMQAGSDALRDRILAVLAKREERQTAQTDRYSAARRAIAKGIDRETVMSFFDLSPTAYDDLAGQVRAGLQS